MARAVVNTVGWKYGLLTLLVEKPEATIVYSSRNPISGMMTTKRGILFFKRLIKFDVSELN
jgi:hypothetical protein